MAGKINVNYAEAAFTAQELSIKLDNGTVMPDVISRLEAVTRGLAQGRKGIELGKSYETLLTDDSKKIATLSNEYENFDKEIANNLAK